MSNSPTLEPKAPSATSLQFTVRVTPLECDENQRMYGGELTKLLDVAAGVVAARHAGNSCLTISADRILFLQEIKSSDSIHLQASLNRSWNSSMEIGVRATKESGETGERTYCCHAYFTFVCKPPGLPPPTFTQRLLVSLYLSSPVAKPSNRVPPVKPETTIEKKRYILAGRRRANRLRDDNSKLLSAFREQLEGIALRLEEEGREHVDSDKTDQLLATLEQELLAEAYFRKDGDVKVENGYLVAIIEGERITAPLKEIEKIAENKGFGGWRRLKPSNAMERAVGSTEGMPHGAGLNLVGEMSATLKMEETMVVGLWVVRPQHCNSKGILFGGQLMRFIESTAAISAGRVSRGVSWSSVSIDSLTFRDAVHPGEVVHVRATVMRVFNSSVECFVVVMAENRNSKNPSRRFISESYFSLVAIDKLSGRPLKGRLRSITVPPGAASEVAAGAEKRREDRLTDRRMLQRVYA